MVMRITGLASGFDTETTVAKLMQAQRIPLDRLLQKKQLLEWKRDDYRALNSKILELRTAASDMKLPSKYQSKKVSSTDDASLSVTATAAANEGIYKIKIGKLAEAASLSSSAVLGAGSETKKLKDLDAGFVASTFNITGEKGSATIQLNPEDTIAQFITNVNGKSNTTGIKATYDSTIDKVLFVTSSTGTASKIDLKMEGSSDIFGLGLSGAESGQTIHGTTGGVALTSTSYVDKSLTADKKLKIQINGGTAYEFKVTSKTTVGQLVDSINSSDLGQTKGVSAYIDGSGNLAFFNKNSTDVVTFDDDSSGALLGKLGYLQGGNESSALTYSQKTVSGKNAEVYFNGSTDPVTYATNNFSISGMNFTAKKVTAGEVDVTVSQDVDTIYNTIKTFVEKYNELIDLVKNKISEKSYRDFQPLTDEQKKDMKEDDIKRWEEKAKSGMLANDQILSSGLNSFRQALSSVIQGIPDNQLKSLSDIGISSSNVSGGVITGNYLENGKLYIDDAKLKAAIAQHPDEVSKLFLANDGDPESSAGDGIAVRMYDQANQLFSKISNKAGLQVTVQSKYLIGKTLLDIDKQVDSLSRRMDALETRYYKQFSAMENYINQMNAQSAYLSQQFKM
ncbi:flagellar filament capping protein FliD [Paenibacillus piri]|uniref:Flagellar hook-associated protein 2 n=1 Tax=Paenibacillus piri TaxID=2547395 RepID=A0A4R5KGN0_9BACL|nr:flagellar filament capping protein FliD [Paenibacillus piri]TDF93487.1 hypothetical protein E1757_26500 [Paenibacillus piri]